jgi:hypothetical protein
LHVVKERSAARERQLQELKRGSEIPSGPSGPEREAKSRTRDRIAQKAGVGPRSYAGASSCLCNAPERIGELFSKRLVSRVQKILSETPLEARLQDLQSRLDALEERGVGPGEGGEGRLRREDERF